MRADYVNDWASLFSKIQTAITLENRFLLTSRRHIYRAAEVRLGQRNLLMFRDESAVVNVGELSSAEKVQILYNHIRFGSQSVAWKQSVKPFLAAVAAVDGFLPGVAEHLGNPVFTKTLGMNKTALTKFMSEPREHLVETINVLSEPLRAALVLVYVHRGSFSTSHPNRSAAEAVASATGVPYSAMCGCLPELRGSFLKLTDSIDGDAWSFEHPTITDALTSVLGDQPHMLEALIRGAGFDTILDSLVCEGVPPVRDAAIVPKSLNEILKDRLVTTPDEYARNWSLFIFLVDRSNDHLFRLVVEAAPFVLERDAWSANRVAHDPKVNAHARAFRLGLLPEDLRDTTASRLERKALDEFDLSFVEYEELLALIPSRRLFALGTKLRIQLEERAEDMIADITLDADLDEDPESHFEHITEALRILETAADIDGKIDNAHVDVHSAVQAAIDELTERQEEKRAAEDDDFEADWRFGAARPQAEAQAASGAEDQSLRSVFADVDQ